MYKHIYDPTNGHQEDVVELPMMNIMHRSQQQTKLGDRTEEFKSLFKPCAYTLFSILQGESEGIQMLVKPRQKAVLNFDPPEW